MGLLRSSDGDCWEKVTCLPESLSFCTLETIWNGRRVLRLIDWLETKKNPICQLLHESAVNLAKNIRELCQQKMITTPSFIFKPWIRVHFFIVLLALCFKLTPNLKSTCLVYMKLEIILLWSCKRSLWFNFGSSINQIVHQIGAKYAFQ